MDEANRCFINGSPSVKEIGAPEGPSRGTLARHTDPTGDPMAPKGFPQGPPRLPKAPETTQRRAKIATLQPGDVFAMHS